MCQKLFGAPLTAGGDWWESLRHSFGLSMDSMSTTHGRKGTEKERIEMNNKPGEMGSY